MALFVFHALLILTISIVNVASGSLKPLLSVLHNAEHIWVARKI